MAEARSWSTRAEDKPEEAQLDHRANSQEE